MKPTLYYRNQKENFLKYSTEVLFSTMTSFVKSNNKYSK